MSFKNNRQQLEAAWQAVDAMLADVKEKNAMMDAGRIGGRYDDMGKCQEILESMTAELHLLDHLL